MEVHDGEAFGVGAIALAGSPKNHLTLEAQPTPCAVLSLPRLQRNISRLAGAVARRGIQLRPHLKTAKSLRIARLVAPQFYSPIAVSTLREAEVFASHGYRDIFYTVLAGPGKMDRAAALARCGVRLLLPIDSLLAAEALVRAAGAAGERLHALLEINCGEDRGGLRPDSGTLARLAGILGPHFAGVTTHGGHSYAARSPAETRAIAEAEVTAAQQAAALLAAQGRACAVVSVGSTPTALAEAELTGVTEMRAGVYMFGDLFQAGIGTCTVEDVALSVLTEVISRLEDGRGLLIDAGAIALSKDISTASLPPAQQAGLGLVCDVNGRLLPGFKVTRVWQEHALVTGLTPLPAGSYPVGTRLRVLPNHACLTAAQHESYCVVDDAGSVVDVWPRFGGW